MADRFTLFRPADEDTPGSPPRDLDKAAPGHLPHNVGAAAPGHPPHDLEAAYARPPVTVEDESTSTRDTVDLLAFYGRPGTATTLRRPAAARPAHFPPRRRAAKFPPRRRLAQPAPHIPLRTRSALHTHSGVRLPPRAHRRSAE